jgi:hypothetical protein
VKNCYYLCGGHFDVGSFACHVFKLSMRFAIGRSEKFDLGAKEENYIIYLINM